MQGIASLSTKLQNNIDAVDWKKEFQFDNVRNNLFKVMGAILILILLNVALEYVTKFFFSKQIQTISKFTDKHNTKPVYQITYMGKTVYAFVVILFLLSLVFYASDSISLIILIISFSSILVIFFVQGSIGHFISGLLLSAFQTYEVGDFVKINDFEGQIIDFRSINTLLEDTSNGRLITIPNSIIHQSSIINYSKSRVKVLTFTMLLANHNKNFEEIVKIIEDDLKDESKYPFLLRNNDAHPNVGVQDMKFGTQFVLHIPFKSTKDLFEHRLFVRSSIRQLMAKHEINLADYMYFQSQDPYKHASS